MTLLEFSMTPERFFGQNHSLVGYLSHKSNISQRVEKHEYYLKDDFNNSVLLGGIGVSQKEYFVQNTTTDKLYTVNGVFRRALKGVEFRVESITLQN